MTGKVLVLGGGGRFGRAAIEAFRQAGWGVRSLVRQASAAPSPDVDRVSGDALDPPAVIAAARGADVIVNAVNPPYAQWADVVPRLTRSVLAAAAQTGARVLIPGNVYVYGAGMPDILTEATPHRPTTLQGKIRMQMEEAYRSACQRGEARVILLRGGDFIEGVRSGNWFDSQIMAQLAKGRILYPGPLGLSHAWAYLPDMARAGVMLAQRYADSEAFLEAGFAGYAFTGQDLVDMTSAIMRRRLKTTRAPWGMIRMLGLINGDMRAVADMSYLWRTPHRIDGRHLASLLPDYRDTPLQEAMSVSITSLLTSSDPS